MSFRIFCAALCTFFFASVSWAQPYPHKPIHFIIPYAAGSSIEVMSRIVLDNISKRTNATFIVEARPGALGQIGMDLVAKSAPDGYTIMPSSSASHSSGPQLTTIKMPDPVNAFTHLATIGKFDLMLIVNENSGIKSLQQFMEIGKSRKLNYGYGSGTGQVGGAAIAHAAGIENQVIGAAYKGQPLAVNDLLGGHIDFVAADVPVVAAHLRSGKLVALGVTSDKRSELFPEVPTLTEQGVKLELIGWVGFSGPAGLSREVQDWWIREIRLALEDQETKEKIKAMGLETMYIAGEEFQKFVADQYQVWGHHIREAGIQPK